MTGVPSLFGSHTSPHPRRRTIAFPVIGSDWLGAGGPHTEEVLLETVRRPISLESGTASRERRMVSRHSNAQEIEVSIACSILNRMTESGRPASFTIWS